MASSSDPSWCFSQVKGTLDEEDVVTADIITCIEFSEDGDLLAIGHKGGHIDIHQRDPVSKTAIPHRGDYNIYTSFQSHETDYDYIQRIAIDEKINKMAWLKRRNQSHFLLSTNDKTIKLWKVSERNKRVEVCNTREETEQIGTPNLVTPLILPVIKPMEVVVEASPKRIFAKAHTFNINSISVNSDQETYLSADELRINLWNLEVTNQCFNIVDIKPIDMQRLTIFITAAEFHPTECSVFVYSGNRGMIRLCDMRAAALCDSHSKVFQEREDPSNRSFFSEIIRSIHDIKFSHSGRYIISRDYLNVKVWDLNMEKTPVETYPVHDYLKYKLCSLYENDCIFDQFQCCWNGKDSTIMTGCYNNFFRMFDRQTKNEVTLEASSDIAKPDTILKPRYICMNKQPKDGEISLDCINFGKKILQTAWHPKEDIIAVAVRSNLYLFQDDL